MSLQSDVHLHVWTRSLDGAEFGNAIYKHDVDAALDFIGITQGLMKYREENEDITIEMVMESLESGAGMYAGTTGLIVVLSRCPGGCNSPTWN